MKTRESFKKGNIMSSVKCSTKTEDNVMVMIMIMIVTATIYCYYEPGRVLGILHTLSYLILTMSLFQGMLSFPFYRGEHQGLWRSGTVPGTW